MLAYTLCPEFWQTETSSVIFELNDHLITEKNAKAICKKFSHIVSAIPEVFQIKHREQLNKHCDKTGNEELDRIFYEDAVRTFKSENFRNRHTITLYHVFDAIGDYHQGLGFFVAFLSLFLNRKDIILIVLWLNCHAFKGFFKLENHAFLCNANVFEKLLEEKYPKLSDHLNKYTFAPMYLSKYWIGMFVHVFLYKWIILYIEYIVKYPYTQAIMKFALAIFDVLEQTLLNLNDAGTITSILRFDSKQIKKHFKQSNSSDCVYELIFKKIRDIKLNEASIKNYCIQSVEKINADEIMRQKKLKELDEESSSEYQSSSS